MKFGGIYSYLKEPANFRKGDVLSELQYVRTPGESYWILHPFCTSNSHEASWPTHFVSPIRVEMDEHSVVIFALLWILAGLDANEERNGRRRERWAAMSKKERDERIRSIPRPSLCQPSFSPWAKVYVSKSDRALITLTGLNYEAFERLHQLFAPLFYSHSPYSDNGRIRKLDSKESRGRRRVIRSETCLALTLLWCRTTCQYWILSTTFGLVGTSCGDWLRFGKRVLVHVLCKRDDAMVRLPDGPKVVQYKAAVERKYPVLKNVAFVGDGLKILLQKAGDPTTQEAFYNGWKSGHYITNVFVFAPDGTVVMTMLNCPGAMHDSELASIGVPSIYHKIDEMYEKFGAKTVMDSAFSASGKESIIKSTTKERISTTAENAHEYEMLCAATSIRQAAEWGMRALQASFSRLKATWPYEEKDERLWGLTLIVYLYNFAANNMDLNQIRQVYWKELYGSNYS